MTLSIKNLGSGEIHFDQVNIEIDQNDHLFRLSSNNPNEIADIKYILEPHSDYSPNDYSLYIFKSHVLDKENDIFQVYEKKLNRRIGWIFPIQALVSNEHNQAEKEHFLKYGYVAFHKLLKNVEQYETYIPNFNPQNEYQLTDFYGNEIIILILSNSQCQKIDNFNIENYLASLYSYGYYFCQPVDSIKNITSRATVTELGEERRRITLQRISRDLEEDVCLQRISRDLEEDVYLKRLFKSLLKTEDHSLIRFYLLYQVIELLIEIIFEKDFLDKIKEFENSSDKNVFKLKKDINFISNENKRISKLITDLETYLDSNCKINLHLYCNDLLKSFGSKEEDKDSLPDSLYEVRNSIVHKFRKLPETDFPKIEKINQEFETLIICIILNYRNRD